MTDVNRIIKVSGCHQCPDKLGPNGSKWFACRGMDYSKSVNDITEYVRNKTLPDNCPLDKEIDTGRLIKDSYAIGYNDYPIKVQNIKREALKSIYKVCEKYEYAHDIFSDEGNIENAKDQIIYDLWQAINNTLKLNERKN